MHLHYPHLSHRTEPELTTFKKVLLSPCKKARVSNRTLFSIFYTAAVTFPDVATLIHWAILIPQGQNNNYRYEFIGYRGRHHTKSVSLGDKIFGHGWFTEFFILNKNAINSAIAIIEVFVLSSHKCQTIRTFNVFFCSMLT